MALNSKIGRDTDFGLLAHVTYPMIIDELSDFELLHEPHNRKRIFKTVSSRFGNMEDFEPVDANTLYVTDEPGARILFKAHPEAFVLFTVTDGVPEWLGGVFNNAIVVRHPRHEVLLQKLQDRFSRQRYLSHRIELTVADNASLDQVVGSASEYLGGTAVLNSHVAPHRYPKSGTLESQLLGRLMTTGLRPDVESPWIEFGGNGYFVVQRKIIRPSGKCNLLAVAYLDKTPTTGQISALDLFVRRLEHLLQTEKSDVDYNAAKSQALFKQLLNGDFVNRLWLESFKTSHHIGEVPALRLLGADVSELSDQEITQFRYLASKAFPSLVSATLSDDCYIMLLNTGPKDSAVSNITLGRIIKERILPEFDVRFASSQVYDDLRDTHFARREIDLVFGYSTFIDIANRVVESDKKIPNYYSFEDGVLYLLVDSKVMDPEFKDFCFSNTPVAKLLAEDLANGTNSLRILLMYQFHSHKANIVAEKLHMHRNTVLYHINKIEKRFGIDLDDARLQERIMVDAVTVFKQLSYSPSDLEQLLLPYKK